MVDDQKKYQGRKILFGFLSFLFIIPFIASVIAIYPSAIVHIIKKEKYVEDVFKIQKINVSENTSTYSTEYNLLGYLIKSKKEINWFFEPNNYVSIEKAKDGDSTIKVWYLPGTNNLIYRDKEQIDVTKYWNILVACITGLLAFPIVLWTYLYFKKKDKQY